MRKCPHCSKKISDTARKCKYCWEWVIDINENPIVDNGPKIREQDEETKGKNIEEYIDDEIELGMNKVEYVDNEENWDTNDISKNRDKKNKNISLENQNFSNDIVEQKEKNYRISNKSNKEDDNNVLKYIIILLSVFILWAICSYFSRK